jgi:hypothetical protein
MTRHESVAAEISTVVGGREGRPSGRLVEFTPRCGEDD